MIVLDTNIVSEIQKAKPDDAVARWFGRVDVDSTFICGPVLMEQACGADRFLQRTGSTRFSASFLQLRAQYATRTLTAHDRAFELAGRIRAAREGIGRALSVGDALIAAICIVHGATLATRNVRDFEGLDLRLVNPFESTPRTTR